MFIDEATLLVKGGDGGNGCCSFRREKYVPRGGPDGGDGGGGGSVTLRANPNLATLMDIPTRRLYAAPDGKPGLGKKMHGKTGHDLFIDVPVGTLAYDKAQGRLLRDLVRPGETVVVARGGKGGKGNAQFATATHQAPREFEEGRAGESRELFLELKLIADVGLVGLPNAGKSTLLSRLSDARPKIADYPFTTLEPQLGIVKLGGYRHIVVADLPGLIEGAHEGHGLGDEFLKHIERTRVICHVVDIAPIDGADPVEAYRLIRNELHRYSEALAAKRHIVAANKMDLTHAQQNLDDLRRAAKAQLCPISAVTGEGLNALMAALVKEIDACS